MTSEISISRMSIALTLVLFIGCALGGERKGRQGGFLNVFQVITFQNGPCQGSGNQNGTCYTEAECNSRGGSNGGTCASGFGVCCVISVTCGGTSSENCTYFDSSGLGDITDGCCQAEICPCGDHICQLRLDFDTFSITGPSTSAENRAIRGKFGGDVVGNANQIPVAEQVQLSTFGQCLTDSFSVGNPDGPNPPTICGVNTGEHMYVEASDCCNKLSFAFSQNALDATIGTRSWSIKVTQYSCKFQNLAPQGCTQYFFDGTVDNVQSYNYNNGNGIHLANQDQQICVRRERNFCRICWTTAANADFAVSGKSALVDENPNLCCDYGGIAMTATRGFDCIQIPFAVSNVNFNPINSVNCGNNQGLAGTGTICSVRTPFTLNFRSDKWEVVPEAAIGGQNANSGFMIVYFMDAIGCNPAGITG